MLYPDCSKIIVEETETKSDFDSTVKKTWSYTKKKVAKECLTKQQSDKKARKTANNKVETFVIFIWRFYSLDSSLGGLETEIYGKK